MAEIFISYSSQDRPAALRFSERLQSLGYDVWIDKSGIDGAQNWTSEIVRAINESSVLALLLSESAAGSHNVARELQLALEKKKHILPLVLEEFMLPTEFEYPLAGIQRVSFDDFPNILKALERLRHKESVVPDSSHRQTASFVRDPLVRRLAVIPFEDLSPSHDNEWFSDGLTEELISTLNKLDKVFVLDRQTSKIYKSEKLSAKQIADELDVRYIVTGSVRKIEKNIRIQTSVVDTENGKMLWNEKYSGVLDNIFEIQEKTAYDIAEGLKLQLTRNEQTLIERRLTDNAEAYELYFLAGAHTDRSTKQDYLYAIKLWETATELDPSFAEAYARISRRYTLLYRHYGHLPERLHLAEQNAEKAIRLDPSLPEAYRAYSDLSLVKGKTDDAIRYAKKQIELDPKSPHGYYQLGFIYGVIGDYEKAASYLEEVLEMNMNVLATHFNLCLAYDRIHDTEKLLRTAQRALPFYERHLRKHPDDQGNKMEYAYILEYCGKSEESLKEIESIIALANVDGNTLYNAACVLIRQGKLEQGITALRRAVDSGYSNAEDFRNDPDLEPVRNDPEFVVLLQKMQRLKI